MAVSLEDRVALRDLVEAYARCADRIDGEGLAGLFMPEGVLRIVRRGVEETPAERVGREEIEELARAFAVAAVPVDEVVARVAVGERGVFHAADSRTAANLHGHHGFIHRNLDDAERQLLGIRRGQHRHRLECRHVRRKHFCR